MVRVRAVLTRVWVLGLEYGLGVRVRAARRRVWVLRFGLG